MEEPALSAKLATIPDAELAVLKLLWERGPLAARAITVEVYPACTESDIGTVHSMLQRLEAKGMVRRDRARRPHVFAATVSREEVAGRQLEAIAQRLTDGSFVPFLTHLVEGRRLSDAELDEIRQLLDRHAAQSKKRPRK